MYLIENWSFKNITLMSKDVLVVRDNVHLVSICYTKPDFQERGVDRIRTGSSVKTWQNVPLTFSTYLSSNDDRSYWLISFTRRELGCTPIHQTQVRVPWSVFETRVSSQTTVKHGTKDTNYYSSDRKSLSGPRLF